MITHSIEQKDEYTKEEYYLIESLSNKFFYSEPDKEQLPPEEFTFEVAKYTFPGSLNIIKDNNQPIGSSSALPTTKKDMEEFVSKKINERKLWNRIKQLKWEEADCIYLCATFILPKYRQKGIATESRYIQITTLQKTHPNLKYLFAWAYSKEGKLLINKISEKLQQQIFIRT